MKIPSNPKWTNPCTNICLLRFCEHIENHYILLLQESLIWNCIKKILPPVRIELTTFRWLELWLWDWRATYCATEAGDADVGHIKLISHDMVTWRTSPYFRKNSGWQVNYSAAEWLALWTLNLAIPVQVSSVLQRVVVQRANVKRCPSVLSFRPCSEFTWVLCVIYGEVLLIWLNIFCDVKVIRSLYEIHCD